MAEPFEVDRLIHEPARLVLAIHWLVANTQSHMAAPEYLRLAALFRNWIPTVFCASVYSRRITHPIQGDRMSLAAIQEWVV